MRLRLSQRWISILYKKVSGGSGRRFSARAGTSSAKKEIRIGRTTADLEGGDARPIYATFTEGFDTADLKDATALFDELNSR